MSEGSAEAKDFASRRTNACAALSREEYDKVVGAAELYVSSRSALDSWLPTLGDYVEKGLNSLPEGWRDQVVNAVRRALDYVQRAAIIGMSDEPGRPASESLYKWTSALSGFGSGMVGLPAILAEIPITTGIILRSIADIGRQHEGRLDDPDFNTTCVEVFAYGGPLDEDEEADLGFIAAKVGVVELSELIAKVALRYAAAMGPKVAAMSVPIVGGIAGAAINWTYMNFYQEMARVLFILRPIEHAHDPQQVRSCFASLVREMKQRRTARTRRRKALE